MPQQLADHTRRRRLWTCLVLLSLFWPTLQTASLPAAERIPETSVGAQPTPAGGSLLHSPSQQKKKTLRERIIEWLKSIIEIRTPIMPYSPEGKIEKANSLTFRWKYNLTPDHFIIRIVDETTKAELWASPPIAGTARTYSAEGGPKSQTGSFVWRIESYMDKDATRFSTSSEQFFSFISPDELAAAQKQAAVVRQWMNERPADTQLGVLLGSYYASKEMYLPARDVFAALLKITDPEQFSFAELKTRVWDLVKKNEAGLVAQSATLKGVTDKTARVRTLSELLRLSLLSLDYEAAQQFIDELIKLTSGSARAVWQQKKVAITAEQKFAEQVFPESAVAGLRRMPTKLAHAKTADSSFVNGISLKHTTPDAADDGRTGSAAEVKTARVDVTIEPATDLSLWFESDEEFLQENAILVTPGARAFREGDDRPLVRKGYLSFHLDEDEALMSKGLRDGQLSSASPFLERDVFNIVPVLREVREKYYAGGRRTPTLDADWKLLDKTRSVYGEISAFNSFARVLYPEEGSLEDIRRRDELVACMSELWELPVCPEEDDACLMKRKFYDVLLWRTFPILRLRLKNEHQRALIIDSIEVQPQNFQSMKPRFASSASLMAGPPQQITKWNFVLDDKNLHPLSMPINVRLSPGRERDTLVRFESRVRGMHTLRILLKSKGAVLFDSGPFNLFFL